jgi:ADP-heptose:LPS heptosyltransferase
LVITSCTSIAHIAAAMGKKVCVIVPISCYYVWCNSVERTPWYGDNIQVFYQKTPRVWNEPLKELSEYLDGLV